MTIKILMPALSPTMIEGALTKWLVKVGDQIKAGDILAEIETDKATMEVEAVDEGKVTNLLVKEGTNSVEVNSPIAILDGSDEIEDIEENNKKEKQDKASDNNSIELKNKEDIENKNNIE